jgi:methylthioribulose-1-phosphate dehydratase
MNMTASHQLNPYAIQLCTIGRWIAQKNWLPATGGNLSIRASEHSCLLTGQKDNHEFSPQDLRNVSWADGDLRCSGASAAETALHVALYQLFPQCKAVLHSHSLSSTVFSRLIRADGYPISGYEMQKGIAGCNDADEALQLVILDNAPQVPQLAAQLRQRASELQSAVLVRGHGLYVWGDTLEQAKRHLESWEFLIACELERLKIAGGV